MKLKELLEKEIEKRFFHNCAVEDLRKRAEKHIEYNVEKKYGQTILHKDGLDYKLHYVKARIFTSEKYFQIGNTNLTLFYFCCDDNLTKQKLKRINEEKKNATKNGYLSSSKFKVPLWRAFYLHESTDYLLNGNFNLQIN